ncbi:hypothetical protein CE11_00879 [Megavirus courdo11]|uniref:Uncharacterized protein n=2 Tax=Megavirus chilense TaxID=3060301 RepID=L7XZA7_9VIRU|nr:hypothetical protein CE11_00879 [Megavirus courdo11]AGD92755.1 hypothetical protein LBA_00837 [Megavirus lba]
MNPYMYYEIVISLLTILGFVIGLIMAKIYLAIHSRIINLENTINADNFKFIGSIIGMTTGYVGGVIYFLVDNFAS